MKREIILTSDGSTTIHLPDWDEQYHSKHGAIQEAYHVFIKSGFEYFDKKELSILEIGLGTGLNAFITFLESKKNNVHVDYVGVEAFPVSNLELQQLNYVTELKAENHQKIFKKLHECSWEEKHQLSESFSLKKRLLDFQKINYKNRFEIIYFDAFAPKIQQELWTESIFKKMYITLKNNGILVTYSAKGSVRRAMQDVGFIVERLEGPPGKFEMLRALKKE